MSKKDPMGPATSRVPHPQSEITWYRTKLSPDVHGEVHRSSDLKGMVQCVAWFGMLAAWFSLALWTHVAGWNTLAGVFTLMYGMQANFAINGMHELGHGFVFQTKWVNGLMLRIISFIGWLHPDMFFSSHLRHHRYTQNFPHDQEAPMPVVLTLGDFLRFGFINVKGWYDIMEQTVRAATGVYPTRHLGWTPEWEEVCYPMGNPLARMPPMRWAQFLLLGHGLIFFLSMTRGLFLVPILVSLGPFYNGWLFFLCNSTQHVGMQHGGGGGGNKMDVVSDFRLSTRSFYLNNPVVSCWYWYMNYHVEHHMYAAVPCYNLAGLHAAIKHDLPPTPNGLVEVWTQIAAVVAKQAEDSSYVMPVQLPEAKKD